MDNDKIVTLSTLAYYDEQLKKWVVEKVTPKTSELVFDDRDNFPAQGQDNMLYIAKDTIYRWDNVNNTYVNISSSPVWGNI